ncbi:MAG: hypothetical protein V3U07_09615 [Nitrospirales bacterium]
MLRHAHYFHQGFRATPVEPHGFSLLRRSSFGYEGRAAVAPPTAFLREQPSDPSAKAYGRRAEGYPPCLLRRSSRFGCEGRAPRLRRIPSFIPALTGEAFSASRRRVKTGLILEEFASLDS